MLLSQRYYKDIQQLCSSQALQFYDMLGICKERIDPGEPWEITLRPCYTLLGITPHGKIAAME